MVEAKLFAAAGVGGGGADRNVLVVEDLDTGIGIEGLGGALVVVDLVFEVDKEDLGLVRDDDSENLGVGGGACEEEGPVVVLLASAVVVGIGRDERACWDMVTAVLDPPREGKVVGSCVVVVMLVVAAVTAGKVPGVPPEVLVAEAGG